MLRARAPLPGNIYQYTPVAAPACVLKRPARHPERATQGADTAGAQKYSIIASASDAIEQQRDAHAKFVFARAAKVRERARSSIDFARAKLARIWADTP